MKVEKISDTQIKFTLTESDLVERNITIADLTYESEKTRLLFKEIIDEAKEACDFKSENTPLMIEAMPVEKGIIIIISKVKNTENIKTGMSMQPAALSEEKYKLDDFISTREEADADFGKTEGRVLLFSFANMDAAADGAKRVAGRFFGESALFKHNKEYYLILCSHNDEREFDFMDAVMSEYGLKRSATAVSHAFLAEHGEEIIHEDAVNILSTVFA